MKKAEYKVVSGPEGLPQLEKRVNDLLNKGWKPIGGVSFNSGYPYQAVARIVTVNSDTTKYQVKTVTSGTEMKGAQDAMKMVDEIT